jgi:PAS domain S-box-containing protein
LLYNDDWSPISGEKHPWALGRPAREAWSEIWDIIDPLFEQVVKKGEATRSRDQLLPMRRHGFTEECYFDYTFSPIRGERGEVDGVFNAVIETTTRVIGERRQRTLRELAAWKTGQTGSAKDACQTISHILSENPLDLPFALLYLLDDDGQRARLAGLTGVKHDSPMSPAVIELDAPDASWPFLRVVETGQCVEVERLSHKFGPLPGGGWPESPNRAVVLPITRPGQAQLAGFVVAGLSPRLAFNDEYKGFTDLLAGHVSAAVANVMAYEEERRRSEALAELDRAKTAFFSNVSHEFRTPLTLLLGPVEDLLDRSDSELSAVARGQLEVVNRNGLRLLRLVNSLLDFSRIEAGRVRAEYRPTDLAQFTADLASVFRAAVEKAGMSLVVDCPPLDEPVFVDREMWEKVVLNLLSNAFKFTFEGEIAVRLRRLGDAVELRVQDTGTGIPAQELPRLFERFHRIENARGRTHEGSGIGLALVQELVKLHHGSIAVESVVGRGTTFLVAMPLGSAHLPQDQIVEGISAVSTANRAGPYVEEALRWLPDEGSPEDDSRSGLAAFPEFPPTLTLRSEPVEGDKAPRILVADDNADMRRYVVRLLAYHFRVEVVSDGEAALASARDRPPDLILTDVMMPRLDGFGLLRELRADPRTRSVPVIMLSARAGEESRVEGMQAGADDYLVKPFGSRELLARVSAHLQMARMRREANESLRESEERLRMALTAARMVAWQWNPADGSVHVSDNADDLFGLPEGIGLTNINQGVALLHPDDIEMYRETFTKTIEDRGSYLIYYRLIRPVDGSVVWMEERGHTICDESARVVRLVGVVMDVTERKKAEEEVRDARSRLESTLVAGEIGTWEFDVVSNIVRADLNLARMFELKPEQAMGAPLEIYTKSIHPDDRERVVQSIKQAVESGEVYQEEFRVVGAGAPIRWVVARGRVEQDESGRGVRMPGVVVDITGRKLAEEEQRRLAESAEAANAKFRAFFDQGALFAGIMDLDGTIIETNRMAWEACGYTSEQIVGKPFWDGPWWTPSAALVARIKSATVQAAAGEAFREEIPYFVADGGERVIDLLIQPIKDEAGRVVLLAPTGTDITDRKRAEIALRQSEERFRYLADAIPQLVWITRPDRSVEYVNRRWLDYTGQTPDECLRPADWAAVIHPDDIEAVTLASIRSHATGESFQAEYRIKNASGAYRWHLGRAVPIFDEAGRLLRRFGAATDIDDRRRAEQSARFLAEASAALAGIVDEVSTLQKVAGLAVPFFADWCSVDVAGEDGSIRRLAVAHIDSSKVELAHDIHHRYPPDPNAPGGVPEVIRTGKSRLVAEITDDMLVGGARDEDHLRIVRELGLKSYMCVPLRGRVVTLGAISFVAAESGRRYGPEDLAIAEDLAARAAIAIENARLYGELKEADRMKDEFLATLAHELRNPLAPIRNALHLMKKTTSNGEDDGNEADRAMAERQVVHLTRLIDDLMDVARISRGKIELHREVVVLATIVNQAIETSRPQIEERRHRLTVSLPEEAIRLEADPTRLEQVLWNLLNNAAKYSEPGGQIHLTVEPEGPEVVIRLKDSGIGIKPEMLAQIFEMFTQVDEHRNHAGGGLGIGLSLVRAIVEMHGGSIAAQSDGPGLGSEFVVKLPVLTTLPAIRASTRSPEVKLETGQVRRRILVVDDNEDAAKSLARLLTRFHGHDVRIAHDGPTALEAAEEFRPEIILLDIGLPGMDGNEVARSIRSLPWGDKVVIIALTGWGQEDDRRRSSEAGFDNHVVKPVDPTLLEQILADRRSNPTPRPITTL